jgi:hypothetical protein
MQIPARTVAIAELDKAAESQIPPMHIDGFISRDSQHCNA